MEKPTKNNYLNTTTFKKLQRLFLFVFLGITFLFIVFNQLFKEEINNFNGLKYLFVAIPVFLLISYILLKFMLVKIENQFNEVNIIHHKAIEKLQELQELYDSKEESFQELQGLNYAINNTALFVSLAQDGSVLHISKKFSKLLGLNNKEKTLSLEEMLSLEEGEQQTIHALLKGTRHSIWIGEVKVTTKTKEKLWLEMSIIPINKVKNKQRILILCTNITDRIRSQKEIDKLNELRFKKEVNLQKAQASQIVEAQEEERKRIAKDIHDGIGQMLTALKFNIESINTSNIESTTNKVEKLKEVLSFLIKEVRTVTFNLTPPELSDYGIVATLNKLATQLSSFTEKKIFFENKTDFNGRFDSLVETNLYRVVQEAVNNALKYANSNYILISLSHSENLLSITIDDDGKGFDVKKLKKTSSMGLFFMKERISYVNGRIFINSIKDKGTRITINVNLPKQNKI